MNTSSSDALDLWSDDDDDDDNYKRKPVVPGKETKMTN